MDIRVHSSPLWREWMREKHSDRMISGAESGATIAEARSILFRKELDRLYDEFPGLNPKGKAG